MFQVQPHILRILKVRLLSFNSWLLFQVEFKGILFQIPLSIIICMQRNLRSLSIAFLESV